MICKVVFVKGLKRPRELVRTGLQFGVGTKKAAKAM